jgi:hypothetical protein
MRIRSVWEQTFCIEDMYFVNAIFHYLVLNAIETRTGDDTFQLHTKGIGKLASLSEEFKGNILYFRALYFAIYKNAIHIAILIF